MFRPTRWLVVRVLFGPKKGHWLACPPGWNEHSIHHLFPTWREAFDFAARGGAS